MDFKIIWSDAAIADLQDLCSYVAKQDPQAAGRIGRGILDHIRILASFPFIGPTVESAFSLLKRGIVGTWHRLSAKHLQAYLDEMTWRFDNRENPYLFRDTLKHMLNADNLEFKELTAA
jgi:plasmid stabilization system protein ParE